MLLLAIDTSTDFLSVALVEEGKTRARFHRQAHNSHSRLLIPVIQRMLRAAKVGLRAIDGFAVSVGPGSFTGLRIGITTIKTLAFCVHKPIVTVATLDVIAEGAARFPHSKTGHKKRNTWLLCPILDAKKEKVYASVYARESWGLRRITDYQLLPIERLLDAVQGNIFFLGSGVGRYEEIILSKSPYARFLKKNDWHPNASVVGELGLRKLKRKEIAGALDVAPLYLYSKECDVTGW